MQAWYKGRYHRKSFDLKEGSHRSAFCMHILIAWSVQRASSQESFDSKEGSHEPFWGWGMIWGKCNEFRPQARS